MNKPSLVHRLHYMLTEHERLFGRAPTSIEMSPDRLRDLKDELAGQLTAPRERKPGDPDQAFEGIPIVPTGERGVIRIVGPAR